MSVSRILIQNILISSGISLVEELIFDLLNNFFFSQKHTSTDTVQSIININVTACTRMILICLPKMALQKKGLILNLSSFFCMLSSAIASRLWSIKSLR